MSLEKQTIYPKGIFSMLFCWEATETTNSFSDIKNRCDDSFDDV